MVTSKSTLTVARQVRAAYHLFPANAEPAGDLRGQDLRLPDDGLAHCAVRRDGDRPALKRHLAGRLKLAARGEEPAGDRKVAALRADGNRPELAEKIGKLETEYHSEVFDTQMGDLRDWLEGQGIRLD